MKFNFTGTNYVKVLKYLAILIPATGTLYATIAPSLGLPLAQEVAEVSAGVTAFIMVAVGLAKPDTEENE